jgi:pimeloyl-ACP methyl ester carboxylesterase
VAGLSLGGQVGVALLDLAPERVDRAVLSGVLARPVPFSGLVNWSLKFYGPVKDLDFMIQANQRSLGVPDRFAAEFAADTRRSTPEALARIFAANLNFRVPPGLGQRAHPVLFLAGEREQGFVVGSARDLAQAMAHGQAGVMRGRQHNWVLAEPDLFARIARAWLLGGHLPAEVLLLPRA